MVNILTKALEWWDELDSEQKEKIERDFGYYGHDIGTTESDIVFFYSEIFKNNNDK